MENTELRTTRTTRTIKKQKSNLLTIINKQNYTSPALQRFQNMADKYKYYLATLNQKIDSVCQKEQYRIYLKEQKLNSIQKKLVQSKNQLQKVLQDKKDPIKSPNGKIYAEILELKKLEASYSDILRKLENNVNQKKLEIKTSALKVNQQKKNIKKTLKESFCEIPNSSTLSISKVSKLSPGKRSSYKCSLSFYKSKSRESMLSRLGSSWEQNTKQKIHDQEQKIIMLRLFCVFARSQEEGLHSLNNSTVELIEGELKLREEWLSQAKQILNKQDKRSLHGD